MLPTSIDRICSHARWCRRDVLEALVDLAIEIAHDGSEGRRIGTLFTLGGAERVLAHSRPLILDPLAGHPQAARTIFDSNVRGTLKELAQLDGAFVVSASGVVEGACRYIDTPVEGVSLPLGFGSRHLAAAAVSKGLGVVAVVVSESGVVRVFAEGAVIAEIIPELWMIEHRTVT